MSIELLKRTSTFQSFLRIIFLCLVSTSFSNAQQSLLEKLGAVKTEFNIIAGTHEMDIEDQCLIKRGVSRTRISSAYADVGYASGLGVPVYFLEFTTTYKMSLTQKRGFYYTFEFLDENKKILFLTTLDVSKITGFFGNPLNTYSIDLQNLPLVALDKTHYIRIRLLEG